MSTGAYRIRIALPSDVPALRQLIDLSVRALQAADYSPDQIDGALGTIMGVDTQLIADGTYFAVESTDGELIGCGGWSMRKTLFGSDHAPARIPELLDPSTEAAKIRAFFVHPAWTRRGIGTQVLRACESSAAGAGFRRLELGATLTGEPLYRHNGYREVERVDVPLANGESFPVIRMVKSAIT